MNIGESAVVGGNLHACFLVMFSGQAYKYKPYIHYQCYMPVEGYIKNICSFRIWTVRFCVVDTELRQSTTIDSHDIKGV